MYNRYNLKDITFIIINGFPIREANRYLNVGKVMQPETTFSPSFLIFYKIHMLSEVHVYENQLRTYRELMGNLLHREIKPRQIMRNKFKYAYGLS